VTAIEHPIDLSDIPFGDPPASGNLKELFTLRHDMRQNENGLYCTWAFTKARLAIVTEVRRSYGFCISGKLSGVCSLWLAIDL